MYKLDDQIILKTTPEGVFNTISGFTPQLQIETRFVRNQKGRIVSTSEPRPSRGPKFFISCNSRDCAWAIHADISDALAEELATLAQQETPFFGNFAEPKNAQAYRSLLGGSMEAGPAFTFPDILPEEPDCIIISDSSLLEPTFKGWAADEIPGCSPMMAKLENNQPISICFSARRSSVAAEAGVVTAEKWRGRGLAAKTTSAWAQAIRKEGLLPIYSTNWRNAASLAVTEKLNLIRCANHWSLV